MKNIIGYWLYKENLSFFFACFFFKLHNNKSEQKEKRHLIKEKSQLGEKTQQREKCHLEEWKYRSK